MRAAVTPFAWDRSIPLGLKANATPVPPAVHSAYPVVGRTNIFGANVRVVLVDEAHGRNGSMMARIDRLRPGEGDRWRRIRLKSLQEAPYAFGTTYAEASQWSAARWEAQVDEYATFVAVLDGRDVGAARGASHHRSDMRELVSMWVDLEARRVGIAAQLIESVAAWAYAAGATMLVLDVVAGNAAAIALYAHAGFVPFDGGTMGELASGEVRFVRPLATTLE